jgi:hypothetical protein
MFNFFKRNSEPPPSCNFHLAAREMAKFLQISDKMAKAQGGEYLYKKKFMDGWNKLAANPGYETAKLFLDGSPEYRPLIHDFFAGCCPGGKFYRQGTRTAAEFILGDYRLDMRREDINGLKELPKQEYAAFGRASEQKVIYHANPTNFVGYEWNMMIGTIEGKIFQLGASLAFDANGAEKEMSKLVQSVYECCETFVGTPTEETRGLMIWDTNTGMVIFKYAVFKETNWFVANLIVNDGGDKRYGNS